MATATKERLNYTPEAPDDSANHGAPAKEADHSQDTHAAALENYQQALAENHPETKKLLEEYNKDPKALDHNQRKELIENVTDALRGIENREARDHVAKYVTQEIFDPLHRQGEKAAYNQAVGDPEDNSVGYRPEPPTEAQFPENIRELLKKEAKNISHHKVHWNEAQGEYEIVIYPQTEADGAALLKNYADLGLTRWQGAEDERINAGAVPDAEEQLSRIEKQQNRFWALLTDPEDADDQKTKIRPEQLLTAWGGAIENYRAETAPTNAEEYIEQIAGPMDQKYAAGLQAENFPNPDLAAHFRKEWVKGYFGENFDLREGVRDSWKDQPDNRANRDMISIWEREWRQEDREFTDYDRELTDRTLNGTGFLPPDLAAELQQTFRAGLSGADPDWRAKFDQQLNDAINDDRTSDFERIHLEILWDVVDSQNVALVSYALASDRNSPEKYVGQNAAPVNYGLARDRNAPEQYVITESKAAEYIAGITGHSDQEYADLMQDSKTPEGWDLEEYALAAGEFRNGWQAILTQNFKGRNAELEHFENVNWGLGPKETWSDQAAWAEQRAEKKQEWEEDQEQTDEKLAAYDAELVARTLDGRGFINPDLAADLKADLEYIERFGDQNGFFEKSYKERIDNHLTQRGMSEFEKGYAEISDFERRHLMNIRELDIDNADLARYAIQNDAEKLTRHDQYIQKMTGAMDEKHAGFMESGRSPEEIDLERFQLAADAFRNDWVKVGLHKIFENRKSVFRTNQNEDWSARPEGERERFRDELEAEWKEQDRAMIEYNRELVERTAEGRGFLSRDLSAELNRIFEYGVEDRQLNQVSNWQHDYSNALNRALEKDLTDRQLSDFEREHISTIITTGTDNIASGEKADAARYALRADNGPANFAERVADAANIASTLGTAAEVAAAAV